MNLTHDIYKYKHIVVIEQDVMQLIWHLVYTMEGQFKARVSLLHVS